MHKLVPANDKQRNAVEVAKRMIWWFYASLKEHKLAPSPGPPPGIPCEGGQHSGEGPACGAGAADPPPAPSEAPASEDTVSAWWREWLAVVETFGQALRPGGTGRG